MCEPCIWWVVAGGCLILRFFLRQGGRPQCPAGSGFRRCWCGSELVWVEHSLRLRSGQAPSTSSSASLGASAKQGRLCPMPLMLRLSLVRPMKARRKSKASDRNVRPTQSRPHNQDHTIKATPSKPTQFHQVPGFAVFFEAHLFSFAMRIKTKHGRGHAGANRQDIPDVEGGDVSD